MFLHDRSIIFVLVYKMGKVLVVETRVKHFVFSKLKLKVLSGFIFSKLF